VIENGDQVIRSAVDKLLDMFLLGSGFCGHEEGFLHSVEIKEVIRL
jgi:hypothetical protein